MSKKMTFNRIDTVKDTTARHEIARAHAMIVLLGLSSIVLLWTLYSSMPIAIELITSATILLTVIVIFSGGVTLTMLKSRK